WRSGWETGALVVLVPTATPGVTVTRPIGLYGPIAPGATATNRTPVTIQLDPTFVAGTDIEIRLLAIGSGGVPVTRLATLHTGTPVPTLLLAENFNRAAPGTLPTTST